MDLTTALKSRAKALGFCAIGVTSADPFDEAGAAAADRTAEGLMDGLTWWSEARIRASANPRRATPQARSIVALAYPYPGTGPPESASPLEEFPPPARGGVQRAGADSPSPARGPEQRGSAESPSPARGAEQ